MNPISANFSMPNLANSVTSKANATSGTTGQTSSQMDASNIGSTFLSLLTQELQNQDPTAPMDSTAMVGQMISLNQLSQLVSINQTLTGASSAQANGTSANAMANAASTAAQLNTAAASQNAASSASTLAMMFPSSQLSAAQRTR